jgi:hypothetical protein
LKIPPRPRDLTLTQQLVNLKTNPLTRGSGEIVAGRLTWRFEARPSPISRAYAMRMTYADDGPNIFVENPDIVALADGRPLPHVYSENPVRLCLYLPGTGEWNGRMLLDRTVVPWTVLWLWYFEDWLATGNWHGGGQHPCEVDDDGAGTGRAMKRGLASLRRSKAT